MLFFSIEAIKTITAEKEGNVNKVNNNKQNRYTEKGGISNEYNIFIYIRSSHIRST